MNLTEYSERAIAFADFKGFNHNMQHASLGLITEAAELCDAVKRQMIYLKDPDIANIREEIGDVMWYAALACHQMGWRFEVERMEGMESRSFYSQAVTLACGAGAFGGMVDAFTEEADVPQPRQLAETLRGILALTNAIALKWGSTLEECGEINIRKLSVRYPNGFTPASALNRNLEAERATLEQASAAVG